MTETLTELDWVDRVLSDLRIGAAWRMGSSAEASPFRYDVMSVVVRDLLIRALERYRECLS